MKKILLGIFLVAGIIASAQTPVNDTLSETQYIKDSLAIMRVKLVKPQFKFDNRVTFFEGQALTLTGFDVGVLLSEKLRLTLGYYSMEHRLESFDFTIGDEQYGRLIKMNYGSLNTELIYKDTRFLSFGMPLEIGAGVNRFQNKNITDNKIISTESGALIFVNFGMSATFKPMRFLGLKAMVGYRKMAYNQVDDFNFDGFFTAIGLNIDVHAVVTDIKMFRLMKRYNRGNRLANAVNIITD